MRDHAIEARDILESSISNQNLSMTTSSPSIKAVSTSQSTTATSRDGNFVDNSDTMAQLNLMISKFESLSQNQNTQSSKGNKNEKSRNRLVQR